jgi:hypothetical protein
MEMEMEMEMEMGGRLTFSIQEQLELRAYLFLFVCLHFFFFSSFFGSCFPIPCPARERMIASNSVDSILSCGRGGGWEGRLDDDEAGSRHKCIKT